MSPGSFRDTPTLRPALLGPTIGRSKGFVKQNRSSLTHQHSSKTHSCAQCAPGPLASLEFLWLTAVPPHYRLQIPVSDAIDAMVNIKSEAPRTLYSPGSRCDDALAGKGDRCRSGALPGTGIGATPCPNATEAQTRNTVRRTPVRTFRVPL